MSEKIYQAVPSTPGTEPYWEAAKEGKLLLKYSKVDGKPHYYPRGICPYTFSTDLEWREAKGTGVIYTYSIMHAGKPPFVIAYVTLDEGVSMMTNIVDVPFEDVKVGMKVKVVFKDMDNGGKLPCFTAA